MLFVILTVKLPSLNSARLIFVESSTIWTEESGKFFTSYGVLN